MLFTATPISFYILHAILCCETQIWWTPITYFYHCHSVLWGSWRHHQMVTFSALLVLCEGNPMVTGGFPSQRPVTWSFGVFFDLCVDMWCNTNMRHWYYDVTLIICSCTHTIWYKVDIHQYLSITTVNIYFLPLSNHGIACKEMYFKGSRWVSMACGGFTPSKFHYIDVIMTTMASQITSLMVVYSIVYSGVDQRKHQSSASLAFVQGIHRDRWIPRIKGQ